MDKKKKSETKRGVVFWRSLHFLFPMLGKIQVFRTVSQRYLTVPSFLGFFPLSLSFFLFPKPWLPPTFSDLKIASDNIILIAIPGETLPFSPKLTLTSPTLYDLAEENGVPPVWRPTPELNAEIKSRIGRIPPFL